MTPSPSSSSETSKVPPPRSKTRTLVQAVRQSGGGGLVDDPQDVEAGDLAGLLGGLPLRVVEVRRYGDHRVGDLLTEVRLGVPLDLHQHPRGDLLRGVLLAVDVDRPVGADLPLHRTDGPVRVGDCLTLGDLADEHLTVAREGDDGRGRPGSLRVGDDGGLAPLENADAGVRGAEVDADRTCHGCSSLQVQVELLYNLSFWTS
jgi:hypothetical protein